jgi:peptide/nickel transport system permease protein
MSVAANPAPRAAFPHGMARSLRRLRPRHVGLFVSYSVLVMLALCALVPGLLAPYDPIAQDLASANLAPLDHARDGSLHVFGTDALGRDVLSRIIYGARVSLAVGVGGVLISSAIGIPLGIIAGYKGGRFEAVIMRLVDGMLSFPKLVLAIFFLYVVGGGVLNVIIVLALMRWVAYARVGRALTLSLRESAYVDAARSIGASDWRIMARHILPNVLSPLLVIATLEVAVLILAESSLSFLGLGVQPPQPSWGAMVAEGREYLTTSWWLIVIPGAAIFLSTLNLNIVAMRVREKSGAGGPLRLLGRRRPSEEGDL